MPPPPFDRSVFINCPFDDDFKAILRAIAFCVTDLGFFPRIAPENADGAANRLERIVELVRGSRFAIHDLSRCKAIAAGDYARMNMPFELGIDHGCARFGPDNLAQKSILVLEEQRYDYQRALSDIAGWDIEVHGGDHIKAVRHVRNWLVLHAGAPPAGATRVMDDYAAFQQWHLERERAEGASIEDVLDYSNVHMIRAMQDWVTQGRPI